MTQSDTVGADEIMTELGRAVELGRSGDRAQARAALTKLWDRVGDGGDPLHRCSIAHYLADLQDAVKDELRWDQRAMAAVVDLSDQRAQRFHESLQVRAFLPSLHLNLADDYRRLGDDEQSRHHLTTAHDLVGELPDDAYGSMVRGGVEQVSRLLDAGSRASLAAPG